MAELGSSTAVGYGFLNQMGMPFVELDGENATVKFKLQDGSIKEHGENGCQIDELIYIANVILREFNRRFPCRENSCAITKLDEALHWLKARTADREKRGVEGYDKK